LPGALFSLDPTPYYSGMLPNDFLKIAYMRGKTAVAVEANIPAGLLAAMGAGGALGTWAGSPTSSISGGLAGAGLGAAMYGAGRLALRGQDELQRLRQFAGRGGSTLAPQVERLAKTAPAAERLTKYLPHAVGAAALAAAGLGLYALLRKSPEQVMAERANVMSPEQWAALQQRAQMQAWEQSMGLTPTEYPAEVQEA